MNVLRTAFASELVKVAAEDSQRSYPTALLAAAPAAAAKAATDIPKGMVDKYVDQIVSGVPKTQRTSALSRGAGRALGGVAGIATFPVFLSGMKDVKESKTDSQKKRGYAKIIGASLGYGAVKGGLETAVDHKSLTKAQLRKMIKRVAGTRAALSAGAGALTAGAVAKGLKKQEKKPDKTQRFLYPAVAGGSIGAGKGALEAVTTAKSLKDIKTPKGIRGVAGKAAGRGAAGVLGAVALSEIARHAFKTKTASAQYQKTDLGPKPGELYGNVRSWAKKQPDKAVLTQYEAMNKRGNPEGTPSRRAVYYAFHDELANRGHKLPKPKMREKTHVAVTKAPTVVDTAAMAAIAFSPAAVWSLGLVNLEASAKDKVLNDALDRMIASKGIGRIEAGLDFWGTSPSFDAPPRAFYMRAGGPQDKHMIEQARRSGTPQAAKFLQQYESGVRDFISASKTAKPEILAHELGHATAGRLRQKTIASGLSQFAYRASAMPTIILPLLAMDGMGDKSFTTADELEAKAKFSRNVGAVAVLLQSPYLAEEATASAKGMGYMTRAGATPRRAFLKSLKVLGPAFATYAASTATPFIVSAYLKRKAKKARKQQEKKASTKMRAVEAGLGAVAGGGLGYLSARNEGEDERGGSVILGTALGAGGMAGASGLIRHFRSKPGAEVAREIRGVAKHLKAIEKKISTNPSWRTQDLITEKQNIIASLPALREKLKKVTLPSEINKKFMGLV